MAKALLALDAKDQRRRSVRARSWRATQALDAKVLRILVLVLGGAWTLLLQRKQKSGEQTSESGTTEERQKGRRLARVRNPEADTAQRGADDGLARRAADTRGSKQARSEKCWTRTGPEICNLQSL